MRFKYEIPVVFLKDLDALNAGAKEPIYPVAIGEPVLINNNMTVFPFIEVSVDLSKPGAIERARAFLDIVAKQIKPV
jgi:hypothetical protein